MTKEQIFTKLGESVIQNYIFNLGYVELENTDKRNSIDWILDRGNKKLAELITAKEVSIKKLGSRIMVTPLVDYEKLIKERIYPISNEPIELITNDYYKGSDGKTKAILIEHYAYKTLNYIDSFNAEIIRKLNRIPLTINPKVLDYPRISKSGMMDNNYLNETELFKYAVKDNINKAFYLGHRYDRRGRFYTDGYVLNYQGDEWCKCAVNPLRKEKVKAVNKKYLMHDLANHYGLDKETFEVKEQWVRDNISLIIAEADNNTLDSEFIAKADKKLLFKKACHNYMDSICGREINYFVYNDATSSGPQIMSILSNDEKIAKLTNLIDNSKCYDLYIDVTNHFIKEFKLHENAKDLRPFIKKMVMTYFYNSRKTIEEQLIKMRLKFDSIRKNLNINSVSITSFLNEYSGGCNLVMKCINDVFNKLPDTTKEIEYVMPDGFIVNLPLIAKRNKKFQSKYYSCSIRYDVNDYDYDENWRSLVPNIVHSLDSYIARQVVRKCNFEVLVIHDSFGCHANNAKALKKAYTDTLKEIQKMNLLEHILKQIDKDFVMPKLPKKFKIAANNYAIC